MELRIGIGYDAHRLVPGKPLFLGGVEVPFSRGLEGHSDADVALHALEDALLGAIGAGDIGKLFPDTDPSLRGISSLLLLEKVYELLRREGYGVNNADLVIVAEEPQLAPYIEAMRDKISEVLRADRVRISVKATTTEGMGFTGTGEGIAAYAVVSVDEGK